MDGGDSSIVGADMREPDSLAVLWERAADGDQLAFATFYRRNADVVFHHCRTRVYSRDDAEDLTSEVFTIAWRRRVAVRFSDDGGIVPWLLTTTNLLLKRRHAAVTRRALLLRRIGPPDRSPDSADDVIESVSLDEDVRRALAAVDQLRRTDRELIQMCIIEELSAEQVAAILGARTGTVRTRLSRALARARREYLRTGNERPDEGGHVAVTT